jgi:hypothetical protein
MGDVVSDRSGRKMELRRVGVVEQLRLFKALGPELSENRAYFGLAKLAAAIAMIDDVPVPLPANEAGIEAVLERLGDDGVEAVGAYLSADAERDILDEAGN